MSVIVPYTPLPVSFQRGEGIWLYDQDDKQYLDALAGIAVTSLGHHHPAVVDTMKHCAEKVLHTSNVYTIENQVALAERLTELTGTKQAFFGNSGAEANEAAIKLARLYGRKRGIEEPAIIVMERAFHGRTMACISASGNRAYQAGFEPLLGGFVRAPFNDIESIETIAQNHKSIVAILVEPIQGEGGIYVPDDDYLTQLHAICRKHDWLLMSDEVQTGVGRTGKLYAYQHNNIDIDVICTAKALGNGVPIGACLIGERAQDLFTPGTHGSTFGGNPFATAVAKTVIDTVVAEKLPEHAAKMGAYCLKQLREIFADNAHITDIRGKGLMLGIEFDRPCKPMLEHGLKHGLLFSINAGNTVRMVPPLIITQEQVDDLLERFQACVRDFLA